MDSYSLEQVEKLCRSMEEAYRIPSRRSDVSKDHSHHWYKQSDESQKVESQTSWSFSNPQTYRDISLPNSLTSKIVKPPQCLLCVTTQKILIRPQSCVGTRKYTIKGDLIFNLLIVKIVGKGTNELRNKSVSLVKVAQDNVSSKEFTWELEEDMRKDYPELFRGNKF